MGDTKDAKDLLKKLGSTPVHLTGDRFDAKDRCNVPERSKPTSAQTRARVRSESRIMLKKNGESSVGASTRIGSRSKMGSSGGAEASRALRILRDRLR